MTSKTLLLLVLTLNIFIINCQAGIIPVSEVLTHSPHAVASVVHSSPSAVSHQTYTRIHNHAHIEPRILTPTVQTFTLSEPKAILETVEAHVPMSVVESTHEIPVDHQHSSGFEIEQNSYETPIVKPLTYTPAHLTYAASPVVFQMLPKIQPVRTISFDSLVPSPRSYAGIH